MASALTLTSTRNNDSPTTPTRRRRKRTLGSTLANAALHLTPNYFAINMGTGIVSILLHNFPYPARWLEILGVVVFVLNVAVFVLLCAGTVARYVLWRGMFTVTAEGNDSFGWGTFPMGFVTIVNMICFVCVPAWGRHWAYLALALWWLDVVVAMAINVGTVFLLFTVQHQTELSVSPTWLLPIVTTVVAAASGAVVSQSLMPFNPDLARSTLLASFVVWGTGVPLALMVIGIIVYRTALHGPPDETKVSAVFLPLGPCGQGSYGIITMGAAARQLAYSYATPLAPGLPPTAARTVADAVYAGGLVTGLILWGLALVWYALAVAQFLDACRRDHFRLLGPKHFVIGLWSLTFPIGVFATASNALASELSSPAFRVIGAFLSVQVVLHWVYVGASTVWTTLVTGRLFEGRTVDDEQDAARVSARWEKGWIGKEADVESARGGCAAGNGAALCARP